MKLRMSQITSFAVAAALVSAISAQAAVIAIVDSGTDLNHSWLKDKAWINENVSTDGYQNDIHGWNFAENNDQLIDMSYQGTFSPDVNKFFEIQTKALKGVATEDEKTWARAKIADKDFVKQLETFGNWVHGTHVAGVASKDVTAAELMILKLIPTKSPLASFNGLPETVRSMSTGILSGGIGDLIKEQLINAGLAYLASQQGQVYGPIAKFISNGKARVVNCSFGTSTANAVTLLRPLIEKILGRTMTDAEANKYASKFVSEVVKGASTGFVGAAPNALFVVAAGNDGANNDVSPASPANVRLDNSMSVAATFENRSLASFSNYGATMVDVAAPGVGILSSIPGDETMTLSGTSQATPSVVRVAGQIFDTNAALTPGEAKRIIMSTVDKKDWLAGKVVSGGTVNGARAVAAAQLSLTMPLAQAIAQAQAQVADEVVVQSFRVRGSSFMPYVLPLPGIY